MRYTHIAEYGDNRKNKEPMLKIRNKLFELENIEEKYGIEILTVYKAMVNGCYYRNRYGKIECFIPDEKNFICPNLYNESLDLMYAGSYECQVEKNLLFKDYGKTWALTRKKLETPKGDQL